MPPLIEIQFEGFWLMNHKRFSIITKFVTVICIIVKDVAGNDQHSRRQVQLLIITVPKQNLVMWIHL